jgi:D-sedoheptulose 7-phosphate isomerase
MGNGGSAADANHFSGEILGRFKKERKGLGCVSLSADNASITAIANDYGFEYIFSRQLEGLYDPLKDVVFTMTTSGNSKNVIRALDYVYNAGGKSVNLLGRDGGIIGKTNYPNETNIIIPAQGSDRIQEMHKFILHYFAEVIEEKYMELKVN